MWLTCLIGCLVLLVVIDACLRREETGLRLLFAGTWLLAGAWTAYRWLAPAWKFNPTRVQVAQWMERQRPDSGEQLSTALELVELPPGHTLYGSSKMRDMAVRQLTRTRAPLDWPAHLNTRPWWNSVVCLVGVVCVLVIGIALWPSSASIGLRRLMLPWSNLPWPRSDELQLVDPPTAVALGSSLQVEIRDRQPPLPREVQLLVRDALDSEAREQQIATRIISDVALANLPMVEQAIEVRAVGGDDDQMEWHRIDVVRPPSVEQHVFHIQPPEYLHQPPQQIVGKRLQVIAGSQLRWQGRLAEPVAGLRLHQVLGTDERGSKDISPSDWQVELRAGGQDFDSGAEGWNAQHSISWQMEVTSADDVRIRLPDLWSITVVPDSPPSVTLREPAIRELAVRAQVDVHGQATDDLGLASVTAWAASGRLTVSQISQLDQQNGLDRTDPTNPSPADPSPRTVRQPLWSAEDPDVHPREMAVKELWSFAQALDTKAPQEITIWLEATDVAGQVGRSQPQVFVVQNPDALIASVGARQRQLLERIRELENSQSRNLQLTTRASDIVGQTQTLTRQTVDSFSGAAKIQRSIANQLTDGPASVTADVDLLRKWFESNDLQASEPARELARIQDELLNISRSTLPSALGATRSAFETSSARLKGNNERSEATSEDENFGAPVDQDTRAAIDDSVAAQSALLAQLRLVMRQLSRGETARQIQQQLLQTLAQQQQLERDTGELQVQRIANADRVDTQARAIELSADQQGLARQLDQLIAQAAKLSDEQTAADPSVTVAANEIVNRGVGAAMRQAAEAIGSRNLGEAAELQNRAVEDLQAALRGMGLPGSLGRGLTERAAALRAVSQAVESLAKEQQQLAQELETSANASELRRMAERQADLRQRAEGQSQQLGAAGDGTTAQELAQAAQAQQVAEQALQDAAAEVAKTAASQAADQLAETAAQLQDRLQQLEREARQQQIFQLAPALQSLVSAQAGVMNRLRDLAEDLAIADVERPAELAAQIGAQQEKARQELRDVLEQTSQLPAFYWALQQAESEMSRGLAAVQRMRIEPEAMQAANQALETLQLAQKALDGDRESGDDSSDQSDPEDASSESEDPANARLVPPIASLKLLRGLQQVINERTQAIDALPEEALFRHQQLESLRDQQRALGEQLQALLQELSAESTAPEA